MTSVQGLAARFETALTITPSKVEERSQWDEIQYLLQHKCEILNQSSSRTQIEQIFAELENLCDINRRCERCEALLDQLNSIMVKQNISGKSDSYLTRFAASVITSNPHLEEHSKNLRDVILSGNALTTLPKAFGMLSGLTYLDLCSNQLREVPDVIFSLKSLRVLYLANNQLTALPQKILQLTELLGLGLRRNQLAELPEGFGGLTTLDYLDLSNNKFTSVPESVWDLTVMVDLFLEGNGLRALSSKITMFTRLQKLEVQNNELTCLPDLRSHRKLRKLFVNNNRLSSLPDAPLPYYMDGANGQDIKVKNDDVLRSQK